jgi:hypothetical protein
MTVALYSMLPPPWTRASSKIELLPFFAPWEKEEDSWHLTRIKTQLHDHVKLLASGRHSKYVAKL